jgi:hypothetical protein
MQRMGKQRSGWVSTPGRWHSRARGRHGTDFCRGTVPMQLPMSNSSIARRELLKWF